MYLGLNNLGLNYTSSAFNPMDWFTNSEQGAWYDADNPADGGPVTAYQEATGITPVTAPGQGAADCVIGFLVDKRLGGRNALGAELAPATVNFENAFWTASSATPTGNSFTTAGAGGMSTTASLVVAAKYYEVVMTLANSSTVSLRTSGAGADLVTFAAAASREVRAIINAAGTAFYIRNAAAGTTTVTALSVRELPGNHATQATTASKPVLTARYNQFTQSDSPENAAWTKSACGAAASAIAIPSSRGGALLRTITPNAAATASFINQAVTPLAPVVVTFVAQAGTGFTFVVLRDGGGTILSSFNLSTGSATAGGATSASMTDLGGGMYLCTCAFTATNSITRIHLSNSSGSVSFTAANGTDFLYIGALDVRTSADAALSIPAYQRVTDASNYDTASFPCRIKFDGVDDSLATSSVDFTGTDKMTVVAGLTKLSDAAVGVVCELSATANTTNGSFALLGPASNGSASAASYLRGDTSLNAYSTAGLTAPVSYVCTELFDIAGVAASAENGMRINGVLGTSSGTAAGAGNFGNHALNIGRRNNASLPLNSYLTRLIICGATRSDSQIIKAERSTALKMALQY
jgi:hypothetical protein